MKETYCYNRTFKGAVELSLVKHKSNLFLLVKPKTKGVACKKSLKSHYRKEIFL